MTLFSRVCIIPSISLKLCLYLVTFLRNRLRRRGHLERANHIAQKVNVLISQAKSASLSRLSNAITEESWTAVNKTRNGSRGDKDPPWLLYTIQTLSMTILQK